MRSESTVEMHTTINTIKIVGVAQKILLWQIRVAGNSKTNLKLHVKCPIFLSDFNQIWSFSADFHQSTPISNFRGIRPAGDARIPTDRRTC